MCCAGRPRVHVRFLDVSRTEWIDAKPLWPKHATQFDPEAPDAVDAAVLAIDGDRVNRLLGSPLEPLLGYSTPIDRDQWHSRGMLRASEKMDASGKPVSESIDFGGLLYCPDARGVITLDVDCSPDDPNDWQGGSGSPVFSGDRMVGVVSAWPSAWKGGKLKAVWVGHLWASPDFYTAIGMAAEGERYAELRNKIAGKLSDGASQALRTELAECLKLNSSDGKLVTDRLCGMTSLELLRLGNHVLGRLLNFEITGDALSELRLAETLEQTLEVLMPWGTRPELYAVLRQSAASSPPFFVLLPCGSMSAAEIYLARLDERYAKYNSELQNGEAVGELSVPFDPTAGFGTNPQHRTRMLLADIGQMFGVNVKSMSVTALDEIARPVHAAMEEKIKPRYGAPAFRPYLVFHRPTDQGPVEALKRLLPELQVCRIEPNKIGDDEAKLCAQLREFAGLKARRNATLKDRKV